MTEKNYTHRLIDCIKAVAETEKGLVEIYTAIEEIKVSQTNDPAKLPSSAKHLSQTGD